MRVLSWGIQLGWGLKTFLTTFTEISTCIGFVFVTTLYHMPLFRYPGYW